MSDILHLEDFVLQNKHAAVIALDQLKRKVQSCVMTSTPQDFIKLKIDGSPAFVFGRLAGKTIVSTKSFFNKVPKYWTSVDEIMAAVMDNKLKLVLIELYKAVNWDKVREGTLIQGDWIRSCSSDEQNPRANVLMYETNAPYKTIVALHTLYQETSDGELVEQKIIRPPQHLLKNTYLMDITPNDNLTWPMVPVIQSLIDSIQDADLEYDNPKFYGELQSFLAYLSSRGFSWSMLGSNSWNGTHMVTSKESIMPLAVGFWEKKASEQIDKVKKPETKEHWKNFYDGIMEEFNRRFDDFDKVIRQCERTKSMFLKDFRPKTKSWAELKCKQRMEGAEGLVLYIGSTKVKFVDRSKFSFWNRNDDFVKEFDHRRD